MKELRFRAWDKENGMSKPLVISDMGIIALERPDFDRLEIMQYTGLKDKNGKEIYEGDIIRHDWGLNKITFEDYSFTAEHIISFDGEFNCNLYLSEIGSDCEVIGNIYENPELIEKAQA